MVNKEELYRFCQVNINLRIKDCERQLNDLQESLSAETKSSAGDKHETGRAMIQLEREQLGLRLKELEAEKAVLDRINPTKHSKTVQPGSLVITSTHHYYIATSIGKIILENTPYFALSIHSPMGQVLLGHQTGDEVSFRGESFKILNVL